jgi:ankyrin repeat protein
VKKRIVAVFIIVLLSSWAYAQATDLFELVKSGTSQQVQGTISKGADLTAQDKDSATALMYAAEHNSNPEVVAVLLKAGADIKAQDHRGWTALMFAVADNQNPEVIAALAKAGVDIKARNKPWGNTALMLAAHVQQEPRRDHRAVKGRSGR